MIINLIVSYLIDGLLSKLILFCRFKRTLRTYVFSFWYNNNIYFKLNKKICSCKTHKGVSNVYIVCSVLFLILSTLKTGFYVIKKFYSHSIFRCSNKWEWRGIGCWQSLDLCTWLVLTCRSGWTYSCRKQNTRY